MPSTLAGNGVDFTLTASPTSGSVIAGLPLTFNVIASPVAGFAAPISLTCTSPATASTCTPAASSVTPVTTVTTAVSLATTSQYTVVGYGSLSWLAGLATGCLLLWRRKTLPRFVRLCAALVVVSAMVASITGCSGKTPAQNAAFTAPGTYNVTVVATDRLPRPFHGLRHDGHREVALQKAGTLDKTDPQPPPANRHPPQTTEFTTPKPRIPSKDAPLTRGWYRHETTLATLCTTSAPHLPHHLPPAERPQHGLQDDVQHRNKK